MSSSGEIALYQETLIRAYDWYVAKYNEIPKWGRKQATGYNNLLTDTELYETKNLNKFIEILDGKNFSDDEWKYCVKRWFANRIAVGDEKLFCMNNCVSKNTNRKGDWDFSIHGREVDLKSTNYPRKMLTQDGKLPENWYTPEATHNLIKWFYGNQSKSREKYNSRLFLVYHSDFGEERTDKLRMLFTLKQEPIAKFCSGVDTVLGWDKWSDEHENSFSQIIYFTETQKGKLDNKYFIKFN